nr:hypothetical protein [Tanacetum cinerariifolium]
PNAPIGGGWWRGCDDGGSTAAVETMVTGWRRAGCKMKTWWCFAKKTLVDNNNQSSPWLLHVVYIHAGMLVVAYNGCQLICLVFQFVSEYSTRAYLVQGLDVGSGSVNLDGKGMNERVNLDGSLMMSNSSPLISPSATINMPRGLYSIDVAATFKVPLTIVGDLHMLINDIIAGKHDELLSEMTNDDRIETMEAIDDSINLIVDESRKPRDPILQAMDINTKSTSYARAAGASAKDQPKVNSNFRTLVADPVFDGVNIFIPCKVCEKVSDVFEHTLYGYFIEKRMAFLVVEYYTNWTKHGLKRIMMNSKGFFFFKFDSQDGLEDVMKGSPWLIRKSLIILKKWSMDTRLLKEELTRILIWVKLHDVPIQVFKEDEADLVDDVTIGIPSLSGDSFTKETIHLEYEWRPPRCHICKIFGHVHDYFPKRAASPPIVTTSNVVTPIVEQTNDGFQTVGKKKKRKGKSKSTNSGQFVGPLVKQNVRYEPNATTSAPKKGVTNVEEDDEEDVQNVYDETVNLLQNTKAGGSSSFTATAGRVLDHIDDNLKSLFLLWYSSLQSNIGSTNLDSFLSGNPFFIMKCNLTNLVLIHDSA